jgi:hypothetical protein
VIPADLASFMQWIGLLEVAAQPSAPINWAGTWYKDCEIPF